MHKVTHPAAWQFFLLLAKAQLISCGENTREDDSVILIHSEHQFTFWNFEKK